MDPIVLDTELDATDWDALQRYIQSRVGRETAYGDRILNALLAGLATGLIVYGLSYSSDQLPFAGLAALLLVIGFCWVILRRRARIAFRPKPGSSLFASTRFEIDATGIRTTREHQAGVTHWLAIELVEETQNHVFLPLDRLLAYVIPKRQITSIAPEAFVARLRQWHAAHRAQGVSPALNAAAAGPLVSAPDNAAASEAPLAQDATPMVASSASLPAREVPREGFRSGLRSNLLLGMRAFFFRRVQPTDIVAGFDHVVGLLLVLLGVIAILDRATAGIDAEFNTFGVYTWIALLLMGLWTCALMARSISAQADTRTLLVVALATAPWVIITTTALTFIPASDDSEWYAFAVVGIILWAGVGVIRATYGSFRRQALIVLGVSLMIFAVLQDPLYFDAHLWTQTEVDDEGDMETPSAQEAEAIFFEQKSLIDQTVEQLEPQRPGVTDLYYVGFAGDGYQRVFRREALLGQRVFADRLGTGPRSLELINDYQDRESFPLGTQVSLRYALSQIGKAMDPNEDVLVLLLTSHGSSEGGIYIRNGVSPVESDLPPDDVRSALDDAGIRWRIVIVSACYSGVFIEPLKTDTTMILTAADSQHTSFGCEDDRDLTYFGEAFLRDSLPKAPSLAAAFQQARKEIAEREKKENLTPSNPQMWVGASMARKLGSLGLRPLKGAP